MEELEDGCNTSTISPCTRVPFIWCLLCLLITITSIAFGCVDALLGLLKNETCVHPPWGLTTRDDYGVILYDAIHQAPYCAPPLPSSGAPDYAGNRWWRSQRGLSPHEIPRRCHSMLQSLYCFQDANPLYATDPTLLARLVSTLADPSESRPA